MEENKQHKTALPETEPIPSAQAPEALLDIRGLRVEYHTDEDVVYAVNGLDLTIGKGESLGLVGETGAGKTTTALSVLRLIADPPGKIMGGEIWFEGEDMLQAKPARLREIRGSKISVIFQDPMTSLNPVYSVGDQIAEVIHQHEKCSKEEGRRKAGDMLEMVGIPRARYDEYPHQFSGGMKQRVVIAMSIACSPELILADEPTGNLDSQNSSEVITLLKEASRKYEQTIVMITHSRSIAQTADRILQVSDGVLTDFGRYRESERIGGVPDEREHDGIEPARLFLFHHFVEFYHNTLLLYHTAAQNSIKSKGWKKEREAFRLRFYFLYKI